MKDGIEYYYRVPGDRTQVCPECGSEKTWKVTAPSLVARHGPHAYVCDKDHVFTVEEPAGGEADGCTCQGCGRKYRVDLIIPDTLWEQIKPEGKPEGAGMLCGRCIMDRIESRGEYDALQVISIEHAGEDT